MIIQIREGEISWLPGIVALDIPKPLPVGIVIHLRDGVIGIESQGIVGSIPLNNGDTLQVTPKIGEVNFFRLLFKAEGSQLQLKNEFDEFVHYDVDDNENIDSLVARRLLVSIDEILRRSPMQGRKKAYVSADFARGEIQMLKTAMNLATKKISPVVSSVKQRTKDIPENRILSEALVRAWHVLSPDYKRIYQNTRDRWLKMFGRSNDIYNDLMGVEESFASNGYGGSRDYYRRALMLAKILLASRGVSFGSKAEVSGDAVLLNAASVFEKYILSVIFDAYSDKGYVVSKGGARQKTLYTDGSFELIPDVVISKNGGVILIADAKYKKPTASDHYQMAAYLSAHKIKQGLLLAPLYSGNSVVIKEYATPEKAIVREVYLPMSDLNATEKTLSSLIEHYA